jgi:hypothetical protein
MVECAYLKITFIRVWHFLAYLGSNASMMSNFSNKIKMSLSTTRTIIKPKHSHQTVYNNQKLLMDFKVNIHVRMKKKMFENTKEDMYNLHSNVSSHIQMLNNPEILLMLVNCPCRTTLWLLIMKL